MRLPWQRDTATGPKAANGTVTLPDAPQDVHLLMPDGDRLPARLTHSEGGELVVLLLVPTNRPLEEYELRDIVLEASDKHGLARLGGEAALEDKDVLRFWDLAPVDMVQRREFVRVKASRKVLVNLPGSLTPIEISSVDLSGGGMLLGGLDNVRMGAKLDFRLITDPAAPPITGSGTVVRNGGGRCAIAFHSISEGNRRRLIRFLFDCQREERRRGLLSEDDD
jgi:hypothetical protein